MHKKAHPIMFLEYETILEYDEQYPFEHYIFLGKTIWKGD